MVQAMISCIRGSQTHDIRMNILRLQGEDVVGSASINDRRRGKEKIHSGKEKNLKILRRRFKLGFN